MEPSKRVVKADFASRDPLAVLADVRRVTGRRYELVRRLPRGAWGAWEVVEADRSHGDGRAVLKVIWDADWRARADLAVKVVEALRKRDLPVSAMLAIGHVPAAGTWLLTEYLMGSRVEQLTPALVADVIRFSDATSGLVPQLDRGFNWTDEVRRVLSPQSDELAELRASGRAEARVADAAATHVAEADELPRHDAVHGDFLVTQLLTDASGSRLEGIVDWDAAAPGARAIDLALLFQNVEVQGDRTGKPADATVFETIANAGRRAGWPGFVAAVHYHLVKMVGFVAVHNRRHLAWRLDVATRVQRKVLEFGGES